MMNRKWITILGVGLVIVVLAAGGFTAVQLLADQSGEDDIPAGAMVFEDVFDDGNGSPVTVKTIIEPSPDLPNRPAEASGVFLRQVDNSYFVEICRVVLND